MLDDRLGERLRDLGRADDDEVVSPDVTDEGVTAGRIERDLLDHARRELRGKDGQRAIYLAAEANRGRHPIGSASSREASSRNESGSSGVDSSKWAASALALRPYRQPLPQPRSAPRCNANCWRSGLADDRGKGEPCAAEGSSSAPTARPDKPQPGECLRATGIQASCLAHRRCLRGSGFVTVQPKGLKGPQLNRWVQEAVARAESLPPK